MFTRRLAQTQSRRTSFVCLFCSVQNARAPPQTRRYASASGKSEDGATDTSNAPNDQDLASETSTPSLIRKHPSTKGAVKGPIEGLVRPLRAVKGPAKGPAKGSAKGLVRPAKQKAKREVAVTKTPRLKKAKTTGSEVVRKVVIDHQTSKSASAPVDKSLGGATLKDVMLKAKKTRTHVTRGKRSTRSGGLEEAVPVERLYPEKLEFKAVEVEVPAVPMLAHGLDRVLFNPGVYRLQDPRSRIYNFDPYLERIMPPREFDFDAISAYETSSKDTTLLAMAREQKTKFTGSTSSMSGSLVHFHYLLSQWRTLDTDHLSKGFPVVSNKFTKIQKAPSAIFLRYKDGVHAIDADKEYDTPNIMSWLGNSLELLLTNTVPDFERYRRSNEEKGTSEADEHGRCYHYSRLGDVLMRSQLDAHDPRLPGTGVFDLKTRAVVSIRMGAGEYETGLGYQLHYEHGEWESYEREYFDMMRATMLKYSLQVRMGRMDGIFVAYHNVERIFGFEYVPITDMDQVLHGQSDSCLGDQEFKLSIQLLSELLEKATQSFPETSIRLHFETRETEVPFMYIFAEPVTEEEVDTIQSSGQDAIREFERTVIGIERDDDKSKAEWKEIQARVDEEMEEDEENAEEEDIVDDIDDAREDDRAALISAEEIGEEIDLEIDSDGMAKSDQEEPSEALESEDEAPEETVSELSDENGQETDLDLENQDGAPEEATLELSDDNGSETDLDLETESESSSELSENQSESDISTEDAPTPATSASSTQEPPSTPLKPIKGWTLTIRNRVNGSFVERPTHLRPDDDWSIEYAITEIPAHRADALYEAVKARRRSRLTFNKEQENLSWKGFRETIMKYTQKGRDWRESQDAIDARLGKRVFRPLGPGSEGGRE